MKRSRTHSTTVTRSLELELTLEGTYVPPCRGARGEYGVPLEPDEPASIEDLRVFVKYPNGKCIDLTDFISDGDLTAFSNDLMASLEDSQ